MSYQDNIFSKIIRKEIPVAIIHETTNVLVFKDIDPKAPTHLLIVPKKYLTDLDATTSADQEVLGELLLVAAQVARKCGLEKEGYRLVINNGRAAGQSVPHLHLHLLAGRQLTWPPG